MSYGKLNSPFEFYDLTKEEQRQLLNWCSRLKKVKTINRNETSYTLKHHFEKSNGGFYVNNGAFKGAMKLCDSQPHDPGATNPHYAVSQSSINKIISESNYYFV